ncbi:MotA/TolQ/ExbB proton channel family protein [Roseiconus nitratireducens]|uniref:MotA/TolQ/ExbB proton channel family protein n=1 Tax=Roseiconus nitratireducens TaxID=2605748 RepID=A0A5M6D7V6_9BACT|nr:MotA/TolQ/ExbB proton channel family protein [Roseiconus nitratireducens]KAA5543607.1 MotA/TolQ/ExbB proton channel family protein [Roseiconus nitratireducens]
MKHLSPNRSTLKLRPENSRRRMAGLLSHLLPVVVLSAGLLCWLVSIDNAAAQNGSPYGNNQFGSQFSGAAPLNPNAAQGYSSQPAFRVAQQGGGAAAGGGSGIPALPNEQANAASEDAQDGEGSGWFQTPAVVQKVMSGGWLMLPLAICSLIVFALSLERMIALRRGRVIPRPFVRRFTECVEDGVLSYEEATELCKEFDCPVSEVFRAALRRWGRPMLEIEQAVLDAGDRVSDGLRKYLRVFHAISNVAPLIGLLGTVIGMIQAFEVISDQQSLGRPEMLASGISTALMTTAGGLSVAIPAYLAYMYFSSKSDRYLGEIERLCQRVIDCISAEGLEDAGSSRAKKRRAA